MKNNNLISVIIPVYNGEEYLCEAIDSILAQTYKMYEIIVVDDGSTDNTENIAKSYGKKIRYYKKENGGVASALNLGVQKMQGEYFCWLSHDDLFCNNKLEKQICAINKSGSKDTIAISNYMFFSQDTQRTVSTNFHKYYKYDDICKPLFMFFWGELHFSSIMFHKNHFNRIGLFNENLLTSQDNEFIFRLFRKQRIVFCDEILSRVRLHINSGTATMRDILCQENIKIYMNMINSLSSDEILSITNDSEKVYDKIYGIIKSMGGNVSINSINCKKIYIPESLKNKNIILFGAGQYGLRLKYELNQRNIYPICFIDNNKNGIFVDGIECHNVEYIKHLKDFIVVISQKFGIDAYNQLMDMKVNNILFKEDVDSILYNSPYYY